MNKFKRKNRKFDFFFLIFVLFLIFNLRFSEGTNIGCTQKLPPVKIGSEFQVNSETEHNQGNSAIASIGLNKEKFVITWESYHQESNGNGSGIFAQIYNSNDGKKIRDEIQVNSETNYDQLNPSISSIGLDNEKFVICWSSDKQDGSKYGIFAQMFDQYGNKIGDEFQVNTNSTNGQRYAAITSIGNDDSKFVICWSSDKQDGSRWGIFAQMYDSDDGNKIGNEFQVNTDTNQDQQNAAITSIGNDGEKFVICWSSNEQDTSGWGIYAQIFNSEDAEKIGNEFLVNTEISDNQRFPAIASIGLNNENFVITWQSYHQEYEESKWGIYAQIFNSNDGNTIGNEFKVNTITVSTQQYPSISSIGENDEYFVITWESYHNGSDNAEVFAQVYRSDNGMALLNEEVQVNTYRTSNQQLPCITSIDQGSDSKFVIVWDSSGQDNIDNTIGVFAQIYDSNLICHCSEGNYSNEMHSNECIQCSTGHYQNQTGQTKCNKCVVGTYNAKQGSKSIEDCIECKIGTYQNETGQVGCQLCAMGQYQKETGQSECKSCEPGHYQHLEGQSVCIKCTQGYYQNETGQVGCIKCEAGHYQNLKAQSECKPCATGSYQNLGAKSGCIECAKGHYQDKTGQTGCKPCGAGHYQNMVGKGECIQCVKGSYQDSEAQSTCIECVKGYYQNETGKIECNSCLAGTYNPEKGSKSIEDCIECKIGTYQNQMGKSMCQLCAMGQYQNETGQSGCNDCPVGSYTDKQESINCKFCPSGSYQDEDGRINCQSCPFDTYQPNIGSTECNYCPITSETLSTRCKSIKECYCSMGYYGEPGGYCSKCPADGICNTFNQLYPLPKPGYWSSKGNSFEILKCKIIDACPGKEIDACNINLGYTGYKCSECLRDFYKLDYKCEQCPSNASQRLVLILLIFLFCILCLLLIAKRATAYFSSFTISFSFLQLLAIIYQLNINWPKRVSYSLKLFLPFEFNLDFLATECSINLSYVEKWFIIELSPFIFVALFVLINIILFLHSKLLNKFNFNKLLLTKCPKLIYKPSKSNDQFVLYYLHLIKYYMLLPFHQCMSNLQLTKLKYISINVYLTLLTLLYLILSQKCLEIFNCKYDHEIKKWIFQPDPNYYCYNNYWYTTIFPFALIFILLYIVGIPIMIIYLLMKNSKNLNEKEFDLKFGLLCSRYNKSFFFWEILIMLRKLLLVIIKIFCYNYPNEKNINNDLIKILLKKNKKKDNLKFNLLLYYLATLKNNKLKKINNILQKISYHLNKNDNNENVIDNEVSDEENEQSKFVENDMVVDSRDDFKIILNKQKKLLKFQKTRKINLFKHLFTHDIIFKFCKWYNKKATLLQKIKIIILIENFNNYIKKNNK
ncbi:insulin-like growth factor binding proteinn-terminal [Anaeramoeba flamelloides]|uniref:Insulin-like growth factor binding proteinn-terminal n=1 Tax=Anaeramoeba flamelloides TaxID=1746091 RepID=A0AAV7YAA8_9EUKA|nr:insulin-like growth factor binding proteinn-terminal [Anaeramoeba flamelloides]